jgi:hypothetical protein
MIHKQARRGLCPRPAKGRRPLETNWIPKAPPLVGSRGKAPRLLLLLSLVLLAVSLSACGRKGWPHPIGPPDQVTYPRAYPAY